VSIGHRLSTSTSDKKFAGSMTIIEKLLSTARRKAKVRIQQ